MKLLKSLFLVYILFCFKGFGQSLPEQDCINAINLCSNSYFQQNAYNGTGNVTNEINPHTSCLTAGERNDVWYTFTVQQSGNVNFSITPNNTSDDYDWAVFNITNAGCSQIAVNPSLEVSCNFSGNTGCGGVTGPNGNGSGFCGLQSEPEIPVLEGETYVINVSNFSATQGGYFIDFSLSSAIIYDTIPPRSATASIGCTETGFILQMNEKIDCNSFINDPGNDFLLIDSAGNQFPLTSVQGGNCITSNGTSTLYFSLLTPVYNATTLYILAVNGSDGNTISDMCGNFIPVNDTLGILEVVNDASVNIGSDVSICPDKPKPLLNAQNIGASHSWMLNGSPVGSNTQVYQATNSGVYSVLVSYGSGCAAVDSMTLSFLPVPVVNLGNDTTLCYTDPPPVLYAGNSGSQFQWMLNGNVTGTNTPTFQTTVSGTYAVMVTNICSAHDTMNLYIRQAIAVNLGADKIICKNDSVLLDATYPGGFKYDWYLSGHYYNHTPLVYVSSPGIYTVIVTDSNQCVGADTVKASYVVTPGMPHVNCPVNNGITNEFKWEEVSNATAYEVSENGGITWNYPSSGITGLSHVTSLSVKELLVRALSANNCQSSYPSKSSTCDIFISNVMTPNNDGKNDFFVIENIGQFPQTSVTILNRYGQEMLNNPDYKNDWNGTGAISGTFFYIVIFRDGRVEKGTLTIIR